VANGEIVFFGTAAIGVPVLRELRDHFRLALIVSQPDSRGGRRRQEIVPAVKRFALENGLPLIQPPSLREPGLAEMIGRNRPLIAVVVAYGQFIPRAIYSLPRWNTINVHFSLLPAYRGAAPVQRAIENGDTMSGITIFEINGRMDAGDVWSRREVAIDAGETTASLQQRLGELAAPFLRQTLEQIFAGKIRKEKQDDSLATLAPAVSKDEGRVDWNLPAERLVNRLRAFTPWPGLFFSMDGRQVKIIGAECRKPSQSAAAGVILSLSEQGLEVGCGQGSALILTAIQPAGKKPMTPGQYSLGNRFPARLQ
jgi:methionyl-tRNA formyltransferase